MIMPRCSRRPSLNELRPCNNVNGLYTIEIVAESAAEDSGTSMADSVTIASMKLGMLVPPVESLEIFAVEQRSSVHHRP